MFHFFFFSSFAKHKYVCRPTTHQCPANKFSLTVGGVEKRSIGKSNLVYLSKLLFATSLRSTQVMKQAAAALLPSWPSAVCSLDSISSSRCIVGFVLFCFVLKLTEKWVNFIHSVRGCQCKHFCFLLICTLVFRDNIKPEKHMLTHRQNGAVHPTNH